MPSEKYVLVAYQEIVHVPEKKTGPDKFCTLLQYVVLNKGCIYIQIAKCHN